LINKPLRAFVNILCALCGKMKKVVSNRWLTIFLILLFNGNAFTQQSYRDSLLFQIANEADDTAKVKLLLRFAGFYAENADAADHYLKAAHDLSVKNNYGFGLVMSEYYKVFPLSRVTNYDDAVSIAKLSTDRLDSMHIVQHLDGFPLFEIRTLFTLSGKQIERFQYYSEKILYYQANGPKENLADCYHGIAGYYYYLGDLDKTIEYYLRARDVYRSFDSFGYANETAVLGKMYMEWGNLDKAEVFIKLALEEFVHLELGSFYAFQNLGDLYSIRHDYRQAIQYYIHGRHSRGANNLLATAVNQVSFASVYLQLESMDSALCYLDSAEDIRQKEDLRIISPQGNLEIDYNYYRYYTMTRNEKLAMRSLENALQEARSSNYIPLVLKYTNELHFYWLKKGDSLQSLQYLIQAQNIQDSLNRMNTRARIASYEIEQHQQEKEHEIEQLQAQKTTQRNYYLIGGVLIVLIIIAGLNRLLYKRKRDEQQLYAEFNRQLAQAETKALRAQMNPHFIFNCLNSINSFVIDQKHEMASDYLIKFSKLIRLILDNSRSEMISLNKELDTLKLYVLLESARFDNKFTCVYHIADDIITDSIMIPPMLLQPYVENAIWHGLMQKEGEGTITIEIKEERAEYIKISISDDGIGREKAAELKSKSATHRSHGLKVTSQRIDMMNKLNSTGAQVKILDLKDDQGNATGTRVELIIPVMN
jgi:hypothetical protein